MYKYLININHETLELFHVKQFTINELGMMYKEIENISKYCGILELKATILTLFEKEYDFKLVNKTVGYVDFNNKSVSVKY